MCHNIISFRQKKWLKSYIDFNTEKRKQSKNDFEKDFFKLMNNSVFGKTMENVRNRMELHISSTHENAIKWFSKPTLKDCKEVFGLYLIEMYKTEVILDKPIYVGTNILDISKVCMMDFHYNIIQKEFPENIVLSILILIASFMKSFILIFMNGLERIKHILTCLRVQEKI